MPLHLQPAYASLGYGPGDFPVAEALAPRILSLPMFPQITAEQQEYVVERLRRAAVAREAHAVEASRLLRVRSLAAHVAPSWSPSASYELALVVFGWFHDHELRLVRRRLRLGLAARPRR